MLFSEPFYYGKTFSDLTLSGAALHGIEFESCHFNHCDFSEVRFDGCKFIDCGFNDCNLANMKPAFSQFHEVNFNRSKVSGVDWTQVHWSALMVDSPIEFVGCVISLSSFMGLTLRSLRLEDCKAAEVDFRDGDFSEGRFTGTDFHHSLFGNTRLNRADFSDAQNYDIDMRNCPLEGARFSRFEAVRLLEVMGLDIID